MTADVVPEDDGRPLRVCMVAKYPPIEGGVSVQGYWLARELARRGDDVLVVTNAREAEDSARVQLTAEDERRLEYTGSGGGRVRVRTTGDLPRRVHHVPTSNPYVTKLASIAAQECSAAGGVDVLYANYLEPYGVAASLAAGWLGVPYVLQTAGSDRSRLMSHPELATAYGHVLRGAARLISADERLTLLGIPADHLAGPPQGLFPPETFSTTEPLSDWLAATGASPDALRRLERPVPRVGAYGKVGEFKGTFDLVEALGAVAAGGGDFTFLLMGSGHRMGEVRSALRAAGIEDRTVLVPPAPHWRVASFLRACDVVCALERRFPIMAHTPRLVIEILLSGSCALVSAELVGKQRFRDQLVDGHNVVVVHDPADTDELRTRLEGLFSSLPTAHEIGRRGAELANPLPVDRAVDFYRGTFLAAARSTSTPASSLGSVLSAGRALAGFVEAQLAASRSLLGPALCDALVACADGPSAPFDPDAWFARLRADLPQLGDPRAAALVEYELLICWTLLGSADDPPREFPLDRGDRFLRARSLEQGHPVASAWVRVRDFGVDVVSVRREVLGGQPGGDDAGAPAGGSGHLLFHRTGNLIPLVHQVAAGTVELLRACDGSTGTGDLADTLARQGDGPADAVLERVRQLMLEGLVVLR